MKRPRVHPRAAAAVRRSRRRAVALLGPGERVRVRGLEVGHALRGQHGAGRVRAAGQVRLRRVGDDDDADLPRRLVSRRLRRERRPQALRRLQEDARAGEGLACGVGGVHDLGVWTVEHSQVTLA